MRLWSDLVFMLAQAGVSLEKLAIMKPFFEKWLPDYAGLIPQGAHARRVYFVRLSHKYKSVKKLNMAIADSTLR
jgi:hypothetical protein